MNKLCLVIVVLIINTVTQVSFALSCPNPETSSLRWGEIPAPWIADPFSANQPQGEANVRFIRANILVTSSIARGIVCTYKNSLGEYSIWWPVLVKIPAPIDYRWIGGYMGFVCTQSLDVCQFTVAN